jgi:hypothetical protein
MGRVDPQVPPTVSMLRALAAMNRRTTNKPA